MGFHQPASSTDNLNLEGTVGRLLLIWPKRIEEDVMTTFGPKSPLVADVVVLDDPDGATRYDDTFIFAGVLIGQLKGYIGDAEPALGRLGQGTAKPGQKPPYVLEDFTDQDEQVATAWIAANKPGVHRPAPTTSTSNSNGNGHATAAAAAAPKVSADPMADIAQIKTLSAAGLTAAQIQAAVPAFSTAAIAAVLAIPA